MSNKDDLKEAQDRQDVAKLRGDAAIDEMNRLGDLRGADADRRDADDDRRVADDDRRVEDDQRRAEDDKHRHDHRAMPHEQPPT